jgi:Mn-dependent DtxR family transcriptional regulator
MHEIRILEFLKKNGESELRMIAKNIRVPEVVVRREVERLKEKGYVVVEEDKVKISEKGAKELLKYVKGI